MTAAARRSGPLAFAQAAMPFASIAWLSIAPLYLLDVRPLPEPVVAVVVGLAVAVLAAALGARRADDLQTSPSPQPEPEPVPGVSLPTVPIDLGVYQRIDPFEQQCPYCGGFEVGAAQGDRPAWRCRTCTTRWPHDPLRPADVVVRSWLHR